ncbi:transposase [Rhodovulum marinum]|uniref:Transposase n=1 Tax=Rhodovulum marinum TaxID=320662 RepID=A0A4V2SQD7_9RHOB|nr:transposase [Rhodovulum marinum]
MRSAVLGVERRRRWSDEEKLAIVSSVGIDGATVTQVSQRHEVSRQQVYATRRDWVIQNKTIAYIATSILCRYR